MAKQVVPMVQVPKCGLLPLYKLLSIHSLILSHFLMHACMQSSVIPDCYYFSKKFFFFCLFIMGSSSSLECVSNFIDDLAACGEIFSCEH